MERVYSRYTHIANWISCSKESITCISNFAVISSLLTNHCHAWCDNYSRKTVYYSKFTFLMTIRSKLCTTPVCY